MVDERLRQAAANPRVRREALAQSFLGLCEGRLDEEGKNFARLLIQNHRLGLIGTVTELFSQYRADDEGYIDVDVSSAYALSAEEQQKLAGTLDAALGKRARLKVSIDESLIGGVYIRAGDRVIDASIRGQIERLTKSLWN
jgi:F-type H+-transporting ATPase subunit delta